MSHHKCIHGNSTSGFIKNKSSNCDVIVLKAYADIVTKINRIEKFENFSKKMLHILWKFPEVILKHQ